MATAFILINVEAGSENKVARELGAIENVSNVYSVYGVYDIMAKVDAPTLQKLKETITWKIRRIEKIRSTQTLIASD